MQILEYKCRFKCKFKPQTQILEYKNRFKRILLNLNAYYSLLGLAHSVPSRRSGPIHLAAANGKTTDIQAKSFGGGSQVAGLDGAYGLF